MRGPFEAALRGAPGLAGAVMGRREDDLPERVVVTTWPSEAALVAGLGIDAPTDMAGFEREGYITDAVVEALPIAFGVDGHTAGASVIRIFHGETLGGQLDAYIEEALAGTLGDVAGERGPAALYLAVDRPDRFITVSLWSGWDRVAAATGGDVRHPIATRHANRLAAWRVDHYELVPQGAPAR